MLSQRRTKRRQGAVLLESARINTVTERINLDNYADLRDISRQFCASLQAQAQGYLEAVRLLFRPAAVLGPHIMGSHKEAPRDAAAAMNQFRSLFGEAVAGKPFLLDAALPDSLEIQFATPVLCPYTYPYEVATRAGAKTVTVTAPLTWILTLPEYPLHRLLELTANPKRSNEDLKKAALHFAILHFITMRNPRIAELFAGLRFPIRSERIPRLGSFPLLMVLAPAGTVRPPDEVIAQVIRYSGGDAIEEVVNYDDWTNLRDPFAEQFRAIADTLPL
jgi:hypothetical protein